MHTYTRFSKNNPFGTQAKMLCHWDRVCEYLDTGDTYPIFMEVNLTNRCNLACKWCICANHTGLVSLDTEAYITNFLPDFRRMGGKAITLSGGGEPTLHPDFIQFVTRTYGIGLDVGLMTNGTYLPEYNSMIGYLMKWVRFSVDTVHPETYKAWKGVDATEEVKANILALEQYDVHVGVNCNISSDHTVDDVDELIDQYYSHVNYIQFRPVLPRYFRKEKLELEYEVWEHIFDNYQGDPKINLSLDKFQDLVTSDLFDFNMCEGHFFNPVLEAYGDVKVCMYHPHDERFVFGNINYQTFHEIWVGSRREDAIEFVRKLDYSNACQVCCKLTEVNRFLDFTRNLDEVPDKNFL